MIKMSVNLHRKIKQSVLDIEKTHGYVCTNIEEIAKNAGTDARTAKRHLELLEEDGFGNFCDPKRKTFSSNNKQKAGA